MHKFALFLKSSTLMVLMTFGSLSNAATYYVSQSGNDSANGRSAALPFKTLEKGVQMLNAGDSLLLRRGDRWAVATELRITKNGVTISAYPENSSAARPIIDGEQKNKGNWTGKIHITSNNVKVKNLQILNSGGLAIRFYEVNGGLADNVLTDWTYRHSIQSYYSNNITVRRCEVVRNNTGWKFYGNPTWGNGISFIRSNDGLIEKNTVREGWGEGIDSFYGNQRIVIQDNVVFASRAVGIYVDSTRDAIIRRNVVIGTNNSLYHRNKGLVGGGIVLNNEKYQFKEHGGQIDSSFVASNIKVYNNLVAGTFSGFSIWGQYDKSNFKNIVVAHNTFVDNLTQVALTTSKISGAGNIMANNIFLSTAGHSKDHGGSLGAPGFRFTSNYWTKNPAAAFRGNGDVIGGARLSKMLGWRNVARVNQVGHQHFIPANNSTTWLKGTRLSDSALAKDYLGRAWSARPSIGSFSSTDVAQEEVSPPQALTRINIQ